MNTKTVQTSEGLQTFNLPIHVIAHHNCTDGFSSFYTAAKFFGEENVVYVPGSYNQGLPSGDTVPPGAEVLLCDFSYPREEMVELAAFSSYITVLDHHATAQEALDGLDTELDNLTVVFDMGRSGAGITHDFLTNFAERPTMIDYVEDRDLWNNSLPNWQQITAYLQNVPRTLEDYESLIFNRPIDEIILEGQGAYDTRMMMCAEAAKSATLGRFELPSGDTVEMPVTNCTYAIGSESAHEMTLRYDYDIAAYFLFTSSGSIRYGFRSNDGSEVAASDVGKAFGGGGHRNASGAGPFNELIHTPVLNDEGYGDLKLRHHDSEDPDE